MKKWIFLLLCFCSVSGFAQNNAYFDTVIKLIRNYSYSEEITSRKNRTEYEILSKLEKIVCVDSVYIKFNDQEIKEISNLFLKKKAVEVMKYNKKEIYLSNMALWPGKMVIFSINILKEIDPGHKLSMDDFLKRRSDYVCVMFLKKYRGQVDAKIENDFDNFFSKFECVEY